MRSFSSFSVLLSFSLLASAVAQDSGYDKIKFAGLPPEQAAQEMTLREGFTVKLFAGEPDVQQPIAMALDDRGRLWIAESYTYPIPAPKGQGKDRILVFEDKDGDGKFDKRTVFIEGLNLVSGMEVGFGGVFVGAAPNLLFIPMQDGDEPRPAGEPKVLLDGWGFQDTHETLNTFNWGPDGWLYGCHGVFTHSQVGAPGTPADQRAKINGGIWRYHPTRQVFEVFAEGTSNPWGVDFNDYGQAFATACVIPHLFHVIQGARYHRQAGQHFNPYIYDDIKTCADHLHYASKTPHAGNGRSSASGGGHAHCGAMIYLGGSWPAEYRGQIFMNNIHGARINMDTLERRGSGWVGHHGPDFLLANDEWSQILNLRSGPDGSAYVIDWYDKQACHTNKPEDHDRSNGRIFKVSHANDKPVTGVNLGKLSSRELVELQLSPNDWYVRTARRLLQERGADADSARALLEMVKTHKDTTRQLRALWALHGIGGLDEATGLSLLRHENEWVRAWTIQLLCESAAPSETVRKEIVRLAKEEASAVVRLYLAAAAQRIPAEHRWDLVAGLISHAEDAQDHNLPLMAWYAAEPLPALDSGKALRAALDSQLPKFLNFTSRRTAALGTPEALAAIVQVLGEAQAVPQQLAILEGMNEALRPQKSLPLPAGWEDLAEKLSAAPALRDELLTASLRFGSAKALASLRARVADPAVSATSRTAALQALLAAKDAQLAPVLHALLDQPAMRGAALRALPQYEEPGTPEAILAVYAKLASGEQREALAALASRPAWARALVAALEKAHVPARDVTAELARQIRQLKQDDLNAALDRHWGAMRDTPAEKAKEIARYKALYQAGGSTPGDARTGREVFTRVCVQCHTLYGEGGKIGPDLTGSNRANLDYILENIVTPNAVIPNEYRAANLQTKDGRVLTGTIKQQDAKSVTLVTLTEATTLARSEIQSLELSDISMMPEGLLNGLSDKEVRDLLYYLASPAQVPLPAQ